MNNTTPAHQTIVPKRATSASLGPGVSLSNVSLAFGQSSILRNITFDIEPGSIHCLVGPNGGGKTSLMKCMLGQMPHTGTIRLTQSETPTPTDKRLNVGYVPQLMDLDPSLPVTVENFMAMVMQKRPAFFKLGKRHREPVRRALAEVGMDHKRSRTMGQLSGGERQRVLLAQAMIHKPSLLFLDEPMTGLDKLGRKIFQEIMERLKESGVTVIWVHHGFDHVKKMADQVTCVNGSVVFTGDPVEMLTEDRILNIFAPHHQS